jgi:protein-disulfide isomerase
MKHFPDLFTLNCSIRKRLNRVFVLAFTAVCLPLCLAAQSPDSISGNRRPLARVAGSTIYEDELPASLQAQCQSLRQQEFEVERKALDQLVRQRLLEAEAKKRSVSVDKLLEMATGGKSFEPTQGELDAYYLGQKDRIPQSFDEARAKLQADLKGAKVQEAREEYLKLLQQHAEVTVLLKPPRVEVGYDEKRLKGSRSAPITIVEFSDFSCPFSRQVDSSLKELLVQYQGKVRLAYRDFPLRVIHPGAESLAEAARCASEQGRFWEYHDLLFANPDTDLRENAAQLQLDKMQFESCLSSGKYKPLIDEDIEDGLRSGVSGTPSFFVNGIYLAGLQPKAAFKNIIDEELAELSREDLKAKE